MNKVIILSGGKGKRFGGDVPKQYVKVDGEYILGKTINVFNKVEFIHEIIIVCDTEYKNFIIDNIIKNSNIRKIIKFSYSGEERIDSVYNGLKLVSNEDIVFIHDGARPFIKEEEIEILYKELINNKLDGVVIGNYVVNSLKEVDENGIIKHSINRSSTMEVYTPQVFYGITIKKEIEKLRENICNKKINKCIITDDASILEVMGNYKVKIIEGSRENKKITFKEDL